MFVHVVRGRSGAIVGGTHRRVDRIRPPCIKSRLGSGLSHLESDPPPSRIFVLAIVERKVDGVDLAIIDDGPIDRIGDDGSWKRAGNRAGWRCHEETIRVMTIQIQDIAQGARQFYGFAKLTTPIGFSPSNLGAASGAHVLPH